MIYLSEGFMDIEKLFRERAFTKRGEAYYFVAEETNEDTYLCVKLFNKSSDRRFEIEVVEVFVNWEKEDEIIDENKVNMEEDIEQAIHELFYYLSYEENPQNVMIFEGIFTLIKEYFEDAFFYSERNKIIGEFMEIFEISGEISEGIYSGTLKLSNIVLRNKITEESILEFDEFYLEGMVDIKEEDDIDSLFEAYADSLSQNDMKEMFGKVLI